MIDWTGERAVPWAPTVTVIYEHFHRYLWAQRLVEGRRVLDIGSGEGYGSALLAETASSVVGLDVDAKSVEHSRLNYAAANLAFEVASATDLSHHADGSFDAVVAFEILEHVEDQESMLAEIARVLNDDGIAIVSTPDRLAYTVARGTENPYHVRELDEQEFRDAVAVHFKSSALFGQRPASGSRIEALDAVEDGPSYAFTIERRGAEWKPAGPMSPVYLIAVASNASLPPLPSDSTLSDYDLMLVRDAQLAASADQRRAAELKGKMDATTSKLEATMSKLEATMSELSTLRGEADALSADRSLLEADLTAASERTTQLETQVSELQSQASRLESSLADWRHQAEIREHAESQSAHLSAQLGDAPHHPAALARIRSSRAIRDSHRVSAGTRTVGTYRQPQAVGLQTGDATPPSGMNEPPTPAWR